MKLVDEKGKLFGKINLVDLGIVVLILMAVAAVCGKLAKDRFADKENVTIAYTICVRGVRQQSVDAISIKKEDIVDAEKDEALGDIVNIEQVPAQEFVETVDGEYKIAEYPDKYDLYITVETDGIMSADGYFTESGKKLLYGDTIGLNNSFSQMFGVVEKIEVR